MRHVVLVAAAFAALLVLALGAGASQSSSALKGAGPLGVVPPHVGGQIVGHFKSSRPGIGKAINTANPPAPKKVDNLTYSGPDQPGNGSTMRTNTVYTIFWAPDGYSFPDGYSNLINQYFGDVAADSSKSTNVYATATQYGDTTGKIAYDATYGGTAVDSNAYPTSDCTMPSDVIGTTACMSDGALAAEVKAFADSKGWPHGPNVEFFLFTPQNVGSCFYSDADAGGANVCAYDYYCAYHSATTAEAGDGSYIYANMPFPNQTVDFGGGPIPSDCDSGQHPNGDGTGNSNDTNAGDEVMSVVSHEHMESITDPFGTAWWDDNPSSLFQGYENGDLCAWSWYYGGPSGAIGGSMNDGTAYNQAINGNHYFIQGEWSNKNATTAGWSGCVWSMDTAKPTIGDFEPQAGPAGTDVTITGTGFSTAKSVKFNGKAATFNVDSATQITATVPAGANTGKIMVQTANGTITSAGSFSVLAVKSLAPAKGKPGVKVTINGSGFTGATAVQFNGTDVDAFTVVSDSKITTTAPATGTSGQVSVTTPAGTALSTSSFGYTPSIVSFTPGVGVPGATVTITGTSLTGATAVKFGSKAASDFTVDTDSQITVTVPDGAASGKISVTTPGGTAMSSTSYTVVAIKSFSPTSGKGGFTKVTIMGSGFTGATAVNFAGTPGGSLVVVNDGKITVTAPCVALGNATLEVDTPNGNATAVKPFKITSNNC